MSDEREAWGDYGENIPARLQQGDDRPATPAQRERVRKVCEQNDLKVPESLTTWDANAIIQRYKRRISRD
jgi:hypothetical protein